MNVTRIAIAALTGTILLSAGCDNGGPNPVATPSTSTPTPSLTWTEPPGLQTALGCAAFADAARETARTWVTLEMERTRRHVESLGVAIAPAPRSPRATSPDWLRDGQPVARRDRVVLDNGLLAIVSDGAVNFVAASPDEAMRQLALVSVAGKPWAIGRAGDEGHIVVVSRHEEEDAFTTVTRLDPSALTMGGSEVQVVETHTVPGRLTLVAQHGEQLRLVTEGRFELSALPTWPQDLLPTATPAEREAALSQLEQQNLATIDDMKVSELLPTALVERCAQGVFPSTYLGAGWLLVTDVSLKGKGSEAPLRTLPIIGEFPALSADASSLVLAGTNWPYTWLLPADDAIAVQTEVHRITADGAAFAQRIDGAPAGEHAVAVAGPLVVVMTANDPAFVSDNFTPRGPARLTTLNAELALLDTMEGVLDGAFVADAVFTGKRAYLVPEDPGPSISIIAWNDQGMLSHAGYIPSTEGQRLLPIGDDRLVSVELLPETPDDGVQVVVYDVSSDAEPRPVASPLRIETPIRRPEGDTTITVDLDGTMVLDGGQLVAIPLQVASAEGSSGYWSYGPRLNLFAIDSDGATVLGQISHDALATEPGKASACPLLASNQRVTGAAVQDNILYSVSTLGVLAHRLEMLNDAPIADASFGHMEGCDAASAD